MLQMVSVRLGFYWQQFEGLYCWFEVWLWRRNIFVLALDEVMVKYEVHYRWLVIWRDIWSSWSFESLDMLFYWYTSTYPQIYIHKVRGQLTCSLVKNSTWVFITVSDWFEFLLQGQLVNDMLNSICAGQWVVCWFMWSPKHYRFCRPKISSWWECIELMCVMWWKCLIWTGYFQELC